MGLTIYLEQQEAKNNKKIFNMIDMIYDKKSSKSRLFSIDNEI
jgi:hypothetical protein